jgi:hypothetical protein
VTPTGTLTPTSPLPSIDQAISNFQAAETPFNEAVSGVTSASAALTQAQAALTEATPPYQQALVDLVAAANAAEAAA